MEYAKAQILCRWRKVNQLKKDISLGAGIAQLSTTLMGTGLFMVPAIAAGIAGVFSLWAWLLLFVAICPIALTFAQLGKRYPNAGAPLTLYAKHLIHALNVQWHGCFSALFLWAFLRQSRSPPVFCKPYSQRLWLTHC